MKQGARLLTAIILSAALIVPSSAYAEEPAGPQTEKTTPAVDLAENAKSAVMLDADTGTIIYEKNGHEKLDRKSVV